MRAIPMLHQRLNQNRALVRIKLLHTAVWLFFVVCIVAIPVAAARNQFQWALVFSGLVLVECAILAVNRGTCPLTAVAARHTEERAPNFDIYLPRWLAQYNKMIFGSAFVLSEVFLAWRWVNA
jgi:uncharacterized membrane protein